MKKYEFILGSSSPRRKELIQHLGIPFQIVVHNVDETLNPLFSIEEQCLNLSQLKARCVKEMLMKKSKNTLKVILAADTLVELDRNKLEKPKNSTEATYMLKCLAGRTHKVVTGLCFYYQDTMENWHNFATTSTTIVSFHPLSDELIESYVATNDGLDKAGAYGIQGFAQCFVQSLQGTYSNVVGLPIDIVVQFLETYLVSKNLHWKKLFI